MLRSVCARSKREARLCWMAVTARGFPHVALPLDHGAYVLCLPTAWGKDLECARRLGGPENGLSILSTGASCATGPTCETCRVRVGGLASPWSCLSCHRPPRAASVLLRELLDGVHETGVQVVPGTEA